MSAADVELVRNLLPAPEVDIAVLFRDDAIADPAREALEPFFAADFQCLIAFPGGRVRYEGIDGLRQGWLDWLEPYESYFTEIEQLIDLDGRVLVLLRDRGYRHDVDVPIDERGAAIWTVRDGEVAGIEFFTTREEALAVAGIDPRAPRTDQPA